MYSRIRELGYLTLVINCKLVDHKLGKKRYIPVISSVSRRQVSYESPWRYYYIVRNSTKLLIEGRIDFGFYMVQLIQWGIKILFAEGIIAFVKPLGLGLMHALLNKFGYLDQRVFERGV